MINPSVKSDERTARKQKSGRVNITTFSILEKNVKQTLTPFCMTSKYSPIEQKAYVVSSARIMIGKGRYVSKGSKILLGSREEINCVAVIPPSNASCPSR